MKKIILISVIALSGCVGGIDSILKENGISNQDFCECLIDNHPESSTYTDKTKIVLKQECLMSPQYASNNARYRGVGRYMMPVQGGDTVNRMCSGQKLEFM